MESGIECLQLELRLQELTEELQRRGVFVVGSLSPTGPEQTQAQVYTTLSPEEEDLHEHRLLGPGFVRHAHLTYRASRRPCIVWAVTQSRGQCWTFGKWVYDDG